MSMLGADLDILHFLNSWVGKSSGFDAAIVYLASAHLFKITPMMLILLGLWFTRDGDERQRRADILRVLIGSFVAMAMTRGLSRILPFRVRPLHNPDLALQLAHRLDPGVLDGWSSLPSDHAGLAFALATGIYLLHRRLGALALVHAAVVICLPRAYLGLHYPSDLAAGALVGVAAAWLSVRAVKGERLLGWIMRFEIVHPAAFYIGFFLLAFQMSELFDGIRDFGNRAAVPVVERIVGTLRPESASTPAAAAASLRVETGAAAIGLVVPVAKEKY